MKNAGAKIAASCILIAVAVLWMSQEPAGRHAYEFYDWEGRFLRKDWIPPPARITRLEALETIEGE